MQADDTNSFPSAVDWWVRGVLLLVPAITLGTLAISVVAGEGVVVPLVTCVVVAAIYGGLVMPVRYTLNDDHLVVRFGLLRQRIRYDRIRSVKPTRNPLSSPALSLNRLRIQYGRGTLSAVMISPSPRDEFLASLAKRAGLKHRGDSLVAPGEEA